MSNSVSNSFKCFMEEGKEFTASWSQMLEGFEGASALDEKTKALAYLSVLAVAKLESGIPFHTKLAKQAGATREEVKSAILIGLPAVGQCVIQSLPVALGAYDAD
ncbi:carboxymuconolactone decarboxylase family protein [Gorillibacterium sp. sgz500922]|uniref:carboxymuconolactone decarboxylase family protein n=1 Tax=Gorillibacterium sp. sgz500922 TaxID=3446694 RepID=UPI003F6728F6